MADQTAEATAPARPAAAAATLKKGSRARSAMRWVRRGLGIAFVIAVLAMIVVAMMPKPVPVDVAEVEQGALEVTVDEDGRTRVKDRHIVAAPIAGMLARIEKNPGDAITEGEVVARIAPLAAPLLDPRSRAQAEARVAAASAAVRQAQATIDRARTAAEYARNEAGRQRSLLASGGVAASVAERADVEARTRTEELASAEFGARIAAHELEMARAAVGATGRGGAQARGEEQLDITSPVTGQILKVIQESEGVVQPGTPLLELGDPAALEIVIDVLTSDAIQIEPGDHVVIEHWGGDRPLRGHVRVVEPSAFTRMSALGVEEQRVNVIVDLDEPRETWALLGDGYRVEARIIVWSEADVLKVPASAVFRHGDGWAAFRVVDGKARLTPVEIGRRTGLEVQITSGLERGDTVVVHPSDRVVDGVSVEER